MDHPTLNPELEIYERMENEEIESVFNRTNIQNYLKAKTTIVGWP